jgi:Putative Flp pilus-assembly TadE/G-like
MIDRGKRGRRGRSVLESARRRFSADERGSVIIMVALSMVVLCGAAALSVDVGQLYTTRGDLQNSADAASIAGAQSLVVSSGEAHDKAQEWAQKNGLSLEEIASINNGVNCDGTTRANSLSVHVQRNVGYTFAQVLGLTDQDVTACATAQIGSPAESDGLFPLSVPEDFISFSGETQLKYDAGQLHNGNSLALDLEDGEPGSGGDQFENNLKYGSDEPLCATDADPSGIFCTASSIADTETGNKIAAITDGMQYRIDNTSEACDTLDEVRQDRGDGTYGIKPGCNPFGPDGNDGSKRIVLIPVIDQDDWDACNGTCDVTVRRFAVFFLSDFECDTSKGHCEVHGTFLEMIIDVGGVLGDLVPGSGITMVRLVG